METLYPASNMADYDWYSEWTKEENKMFESALAMFDEKTPDRWRKVAEMIPGKTEIDVIKQYQDLEEDVCEIESGRFPIPPGYPQSYFTLELGDDRDFDANRKRPAKAAARGSDQERKKGIPWTPEEHRRFLLGLLKHGKGDWRNISRNYVVTKTPTQVASHAQKYFMRQHSGGKDKRRPSIHDITTVNLTSNTPPETNGSPSDQSPPEQKSTESPNVLLDWNAADDGGAAMVFGSTHGNLLDPSPYDGPADGIKMQFQKLYSHAHYAAHATPQNSLYLRQSARHQIHG
ncbi:transcription factor DIVARICATA-like [Pyrus ussuriensis x Pyrus communis]|uniref:Transcription factor DIVARICATA-like n=1 Tax=Pyrus ussuriensis x Pyrus communis TaxID=2448454 RepID=A0A5N5EZS9_9ROSA|nr:transcription factor DIVARICATA-like [Pyrus x bretschneideri]KAB2596227.1 transcription factor DIVARICATA-like [Pyrus ussuriensis x Pyrus communis]